MILSFSDREEAVVDRASLYEAKERAALAANRLNELETADPYNGWDVTKAWEGFVSELARSFNKLFHGEIKESATYAVTRQIRTDRREDPLLSYLVVARNSLEHGLGLSGTVGGTGRPLARHEGVPMASFTLQDESGTEQVMSFTRENTLVMDDLKPILVPVFDKKKRRYDPPKWHLGDRIADYSPVGVGRIALRYLGERLSDLENLA